MNFWLLRFVKLLISNYTKLNAGKLIVPQNIAYSIFALLLFVFNNFAQSQNFANARLIIDSYKKDEVTKIKLGLLVNLEPGWHLYWRNSGDTGIPTTIEISLPEGYTASEIKFPVPKAFEFDGLVSFGYDDQVLFIIEINPPPKIIFNEHTFSVKLKSLICKDVCVPFDTTLLFIINLKKDYIAASEIVSFFNQNEQHLPIKDSNFKASAILKEDTIYLKINDLSSINRTVKSVYFLPYENGYFLNSIQQKINWADDHFELILEPESFRTKIPKEVHGILIHDNEEEKAAYEIKIPIVRETNN